MKDFGIRISKFTREVATDQDGNWAIAQIKFNLDPSNDALTGMAWSPEFFEIELSDVMRQDLVEMLRFYADKLESGELDRRMKEITAGRR